MQARKLIRILSQMIEKDESLKYAEVCIDRKYVSRFSEYDAISFNEVSTDVIQMWNGEDHQKIIIMLGKF